MILPQKTAVWPRFSTPKAVAHRPHAQEGRSVVLEPTNTT